MSTRNIVPESWTIWVSRKLREESWRPCWPQVRLELGKVHFTVCAFFALVEHSPKLPMVPEGFPAVNFLFWLPARTCLSECSQTSFSETFWVPMPLESSGMVPDNGFRILTAHRNLCARMLQNDVFAHLSGPVAPGGSRRVPGRQLVDT